MKQCEKKKKYIYGFEQYQTIRSFGDNIYTWKINIDEAEIDQSNLLKIYYKLIINLDLEH